MKSKFIYSAVVLAIAAASSPANAQVAGEKIPNSYICVFKKDAVSRSAVAGEADRIVRGQGGLLRNLFSVALRGFAADLPEQAIQRVKEQNPSIAYCEQDQVVTLVPIQISARPGGDVTVQAQETPWGVARVGGGATGTYATAWVIDTGIDLTHPELNVDTTRSKSFLSNSTSAKDQNGHGTHVAGTIAARNNSSGVIGVAPGAPVVAVRVLDRRGSGTNSGVIAGVDYVAQYGRAGDVANMSLGGGTSTALDDAVLAASAGGVRFLLAAGNSSASATTSSPARVNGPNVYTVSAFEVGDRFASYSNYGNPPIDYSEPGTDIKSTWLNGGYKTISGTSMATPHLAGLMLLGAVRNGGAVTGDPDGNADVIGVR
ncbi:MAG: S8 family serine peptidase [Sphingorhabdus sp.]